MQEIWKPIIGFNGHYEVSNYGNVRSIDRFINYPPNQRTKSFAQFLKGKILKPCHQHSGYLSVLLPAGNGKYKHHLVHRLVASAFIENPQCLPQVNHLNCDKADNRAQNLEWTDASGNCFHASVNGRYQSGAGEKSSTAKLTEIDVINIRSLLESRVPQRVIATRFNISQKAVSAINQLKTWSHLPWERSHLSFKSPYGR